MKATQLLRLACVAILAAATLTDCSSGAGSDAISGEPSGSRLPVLSISTDSVVVALTSGASQISQNIEITSSTSTPLTGLTVGDIVFGTGQLGGWLTLALSAQTAPATLAVTINATTLPAGSYDATVNLSASGVSGKAVRVQLTVRPRPRLSLEGRTVSLDAGLGAAIPPQAITVVSVGGTIEGITVGKPDCGPSTPSWLTASLDGPTAPTTLRLAASSSGMAAGSYSCTVAVSTSQALVDSASQSVTATLTLRGVPRIGISTDTVSISVFRQNDADPRSVLVTNVGTGTLGGLSVGQVSYAPTTTPGWLTASFDSSTAPAHLTLRAASQNLPSGTYYATVPILSSANGVANSPKLLTVALLVLSRPPGLVAVPAQVSLTWRQGDPVGGPWVDVAILPTGDGIVTHMGFPNSPPPYPVLWSQVALGCHTTEFDAPCTLQIRPITGSLTPGVYTGIVTVKSFAQNITLSVPVTLTVTP